jgi:hypothetical protein
MNEKPSALEMRLGASFLKTVDEWRRKQKGLPSRAEAIRRLVERGLANQPCHHYTWNQKPQVRLGDTSCISPRFSMRACSSD